MGAFLVLSMMLAVAGGTVFWLLPLWSILGTIGLAFMVVGVFLTTEALRR